MGYKILIGLILGGVIGGVVGYAGKCAGGSCPLTCHPVGGIIVGAIIGFLIASSLSTGRHIEPPAAAAPEESHVLQLAAEADFDGVLKDNKVVLVDFYADWCGPCRMMKPVIGEVAAQYADRAKVVAVNVDAFRSLAGRYGVRSIPDIRVFKEGKAARTFVGVTGKDALVAAIEEALK